MVGVDEVGRGALAGPLLVVAARQTNFDIPPDIKDSKLLTKVQRENLLEPLMACFEFGEGWVKPAEIDRRGLGSALRLGVRRALSDLKVSAAEEVVIDGGVNYVPKKFKNSRCEVDADANLPAVSAASIYAKVLRDNFMVELAGNYSRFSFAQHIGYGTARHHIELRTHGPLASIHRFSFAPVRQLGLL